MILRLCCVNIRGVRFATQKAASMPVRIGRKKIQQK